MFVGNLTTEKPSLHVFVVGWLARDRIDKQLCYFPIHQTGTVLYTVLQVWYIQVWLQWDVYYVLNKIAVNFSDITIIGFC